VDPTTQVVHGVKTYWCPNCSAGMVQGGRAQHGVDGVPVAVQARVAEEGGGPAGDGFGDGLDDHARQRPLQRRPPDPGMDDLDQGGGARDDSQIVRPRQGEPPGHFAVTQDGSGQTFAVEHQGAPGNGG
jgi:hypothetical protein